MARRESQRPHLPIVVKAFYAAAAFNSRIFLFRLGGPAHAHAYAGAVDSGSGQCGLGDRTDRDGARVFGSIFRMLGAAGEWLTTVIAAVFFLALLLAGGLFLTGRGIQA